MIATQSLCLKIASLLWIIWGLARIFAGVEATALDMIGGLQAFADSVSPELPAMMEEHAAVGGMPNQDGLGRCADHRHGRRRCNASQALAHRIQRGGGRTDSAIDMLSRRYRVFLIC